MIPFLMFEGAARQAMEFYVSLFDDGQVLSVTPREDPSRGIQLAVFRVAGQQVMCSDSDVSQAFSFTPSLSLFVTCTDEEEIARLHKALVDGGTDLMPLSHYGFSTRFAWLNDRFGVSWQLNLP